MLKLVQIFCKKTRKKTNKKQTWSL